MELKTNEDKTNEDRWLSPKHVQDILSVSKTKANEVIHHIADEDPGAVIKFGRCLRVSEDTLMRWVKHHRYPKD